MRKNNVNTQSGHWNYDPILLPIAAGIVIRQIRENKRLTQSDLAIKADMNLSYISNVENGRNNISIVKLFLISYSLEVLPNAVLERAHLLILPLNAAIRNHTPREAERLIFEHIPALKDVDSIVRKGYSVAVLPMLSLQALEQEARSRPE